MNRNRHLLARGWTLDVSLSLLSVLVFVLALCPGTAGTASAADPSSYTVGTFQSWLKQYADAKPDFKAGDVLTAKALERMRPFVPPGYLEQLNFPNFKAQVIDASSTHPGVHLPALYRAVRLTGQIAQRRRYHELHLWPALSERDSQYERCNGGVQGGVELYLPLSLFWLLRPQRRYGIDSPGV